MNWKKENNRILMSAEVTGYSGIGVTFHWN